MGVAAGVGAERLELVMDPLHRQVEVALAADLAGAGLGRTLRIGQRPARGEDARPVAERLDAEAAVVGERRQAAEIGGGARLQIGIVDEGGADLVGLGQIELGRRDRLDAVGAEQFADLAHLAFVVAGDDQPAGSELPHRPGRLVLRREDLRAADPGEAKQPEQAFLVETFALRA